jgi:hypothetical protein
MIRRALTGTAVAILAMACVVGAVLAAIHATNALCKTIWG